MVLRAETDGNYTRVDTASDRALGSGIQAGDFDADGRSDLATSLPPGGAGQAGVRIWRGLGDGRFDIAETVAAINANTFFLVHDWNRDGKLDLGLGGTSGIQMLAGRGDGTLRAPQTLLAPGLARTVVGIDANGDGEVDLLTGGTATGGGAVMVSLNRGGGLFDDSPRIATGGVAPLAVQIGDIDGDGRNDLVAATANGVNVSIAQGGGAFAAPVAYGLGRVGELALADIDGDGSLDIAASVVANGLPGGSSGVAILLNDGTGLFSNRGLAVARTGLANGSGPTSLVLRDLNNDGRIDVAARLLGRFVNGAFADSGIGVALGRGDGSFGDAVVSAAGVDLPGSRGGLAAGDFDGDGMLDLAAVASGFANGGAAPADDGVHLLFGNGDGSYRSGPALLADHVPGVSARSLAVADLNGDGRLDLVVTRYGGFTVDAQDDTSVFLGNGDGSFAAPLSFDGGIVPAELKLVDMDADGKLDLLIREAAFDDQTGGLNIYLGRGDGSVGPRQRYFAGDSRSLAAGDVDGDGRIDVVVGDGTALELRLLRGNGAGGVLAPSVTRAGATPNWMAPVDFNVDGVPDLVYADARRSVGLLIGRGDGSFDAPGTVQIPDRGGFAFGDSAPREVTLADLDGDGRQEIVASLLTSGAIVSVPLDDEGDAGTPVYLTDGIGFNSHAAFGDFDGDGRLDVANVHNVFGDFGARLTMLRGQGDGSFVLAPEVVVGNRAADIRAADLNGDGHLDLVITNEGENNPNLVYNGSIAVLIGRGDGSFDAPVSYASNQPFGALTLTDIDSDGFLDIAAVRGASARSDRGFAVLLNRQDGSFGEPSYYDPGIPTTDQVLAIAAADLQGDGAPELVLSQGFRDGLLRIVPNRAAQAGVDVTNPPLALRRARCIPWPGWRSAQPSAG